MQMSNASTVLKIKKNIVMDEVIKIKVIIKNENNLFMRSDMIFLAHAYLNGKRN